MQQTFMQHGTIVQAVARLAILQSQVQMSVYTGQRLLDS